MNGQIGDGTTQPEAVISVVQKNDRRTSGAGKSCARQRVIGIGVQYHEVEVRTCNGAYCCSRVQVADFGRNTQKPTSVLDYKRLQILAVGLAP